jgi:hypothetical protein
MEGEEEYILEEEEVYEYDESRQNEVFSELKKEKLRKERSSKLWLPTKEALSQIISQTKVWK